MDRHGIWLSGRMLMLADLARLAVGWPLALSLAVVVTTQGLASGRRRLALNEALHELRRPLQALALSSSRESAVGADLTRQAAAALERLEREVNGEAGGLPPEALDLGELAARAVRRWRLAAGHAGARLELHEGPRVRVLADRDGLERALDNLIANSIEHGGPRVVVAVESTHSAARLLVADGGGRSGRADLVHAAATNSTSLLGAAVTRLSGRRRRGHGLRVARRVAAESGGELRLRRDGAWTEATLELPRSRSEGTA